MSDPQDKPPGSRPRLRLPFEKRRTDAGEWAYDHRRGLLVTVIVYLVLGIVFVSSRIVLNGRSETPAIAIDLTCLDEVREELERARELNRLLNAPADDTPAANRVSNEGATEEDRRMLDSRLQDAKGLDASEIYDEAADVQRRMRGNRDRYEQGLNEQRAMSRPGRDAGGPTDESPNRGRTQGRVTISYLIVDPLRHDVSLWMPAYLCEGSGEVTVIVALDRNGRVVSATLDRANSSSDPCMTRAAVDAALRSRFNVEPAAPEKQVGTITYLFIPQ